jgi:hypothetical protein
MMDLSMSWSWLLLECSYPFGKDFDRSMPGEPARFGSAFHDLLAQGLRGGVLSKKWVPVIAEKWHVSSSVEELDTLTRSARETLLTWLGKNEFRVTFPLKGAMIEEAVALSPGFSARLIPPHDADHKYHGLAKDEIPGTLDLAVVDKKTPLLVLDHKTGEEDFSRPLDKAQLLSLAAAMMRVFSRKEAIVGVLHARRRGMPKVYADRVKLSELKEYETRLATAAGHIGDGSMRPGPWCARCPAQSVCPARDSELLARAGDVLTGLTAAGGALSNGGVKGTDLAIRSSAVMSVEKKLGLLYSITKKAELMAGRVREELKGAILASAGRLAPETPDGEVLTVREYEKESVSKSSIVEAYGPKQGKRELDRLRRAGAVRLTKVQALWPEKERGR